MHDDPLNDDISLDITPLIDVIFMLLIFFIMTTTFSKPVLDIVLPQSETSEDPTANKGELLISVREDGSMLASGTADGQGGRQGAHRRPSRGHAQPLCR